MKHLFFIFAFSLFSTLSLAASNNFSQNKYQGCVCFFGPTISGLRSWTVRGFTTTKDHQFKMVDLASGYSSIDGNQDGIDCGNTVRSFKSAGVCPMPNIDKTFVKKYKQTYRYTCSYR